MEILRFLKVRYTRQNNYLLFIFRKYHVVRIFKFQVRVSMSFMFALYSKFLLIFPRFFSKYSVPTFATTIMKRDSSHIPKVTSNTVSKDVARSSRAKSANSSTSSSSSNRPAGEARPRSSTPPHNRKSKQYGLPQLRTL